MQGTAAPLYREENENQRIKWLMRTREAHGWHRPGQSAMSWLLSTAFHGASRPSRILGSGRPKKLQKFTSAFPFSVPSRDVNSIQKSLGMRRWMNHFRKVLPSPNPKTVVGMGEGRPGRGPHRGQALHEPAGSLLSLGGLNPSEPSKPSTLTSWMGSGAATTCSPSMGQRPAL